MNIVEPLLAVGIGLLIGYVILMAIRLHVAEQRAGFSAGLLLKYGAKLDAHEDRFKRVDQHLEAHRRFMRNAVSDASGLGADFMRRLDEHDKRISKLDRAGHRHGEMEKR